MSGCCGAMCGMRYHVSGCCGAMCGMRYRVSGGRRVLLNLSTHIPQPD